ncbi:MAG: hypothetical protein LBV32_10060, partial [Tannerellaceae bacterium]|nr:hypothetical protein [Tannerellaceae bacterium]
MNELYNIGSTFVSSTLLLALGLMLICLSSADSPLLGNYRRARYALGSAYLFFAPLNVVEYLFTGPTPD